MRIRTEHLAAFGYPSPPCHGGGQRKSKTSQAELVHTLESSGNTHMIRKRISILAKYVTQTQNKEPCFESVASCWVEPRFLLAAAVVLNVPPPYNNYFVDVVGTRKYCYNFSH